ncbi:hypothetical protein CE91St36_19170 [Christensenellaceae bacterium]|nr:hypothetical protein CE91St36_19170 [Christensenellaceae bacterium]BDF61767.1 hypothetical protein CE91St37_19170 [Christensenellaceae bacterium]
MDTVLMALVYSNDSSAPPFTFAEMQKDAGVLESVDVAVILKCRFSGEDRIMISNGLCASLPLFPQNVHRRIQSARIERRAL